MGKQMLILLALFGILQLTLGKALLNGNLQHLGFGCDVLFVLHCLGISFVCRSSPDAAVWVKKKVWSRIVYLIGGSGIPCNK